MKAVKAVRPLAPVVSVIDEEEIVPADYGCLRKVVKRGLPYEHLVDRRYVLHIDFP